MEDIRPSPLLDLIWGLRILLQSLLRCSLHFQNETTGLHHSVWSLHAFNHPSLASSTTPPFPPSPLPPPPLPSPPSHPCPPNFLLLLTIFHSSSAFSFPYTSFITPPPQPPPPALCFLQWVVCVLTLLWLLISGSCFRHGGSATSGLAAVIRPWQPPARQINNACTPPLIRSSIPPSLLVVFLWGCGPSH